MLISHSIDRVVEPNSQIVMDYNFPPLQSHVVIAFDATKELKEHELQLAVTNIRLRGDILSSGNTLLLLGVLHTVLHPMGYLTRVCTDSIFGTSARAMEEEVSKKVDSYVNMLKQSAEQCKDEGVDIKVKITAGIPIKQVIWQEVMSCRATWVILDSKTTTVEEILTIDIKPGWKKGTKITFPEKGHEQPNVIPADLIFVIDEKPHATFKRDGNDLVVNRRISLVDALTGTTINLTTLDGRNLTIPVTDVVRPGYEMLVPKEGMPIAKEPGKKGNLRIKFDVKFPSRLTPEQKSGLRRLLGG